MPKYRDSGWFSLEASSISGPVARAINSWDAHGPDDLWA